MKTTINISRSLAVDRCVKESDRAFWISIGEPDQDETRLDSDFHIDFWDIEQPITVANQRLYPMSYEQAVDLAKVISYNQETSLVINCQAGISRSAAVCAFARDYLGYFWPCAHECYNKHVYKMLKEAYLKL